MLAIIELVYTHLDLQKGFLLVHLKPSSSEQLISTITIALVILEYMPAGVISCFSLPSKPYCPLLGSCGKTHCLFVCGQNSCSVTQNHKPLSVTEELKIDLLADVSPWELRTIAMRYACDNSLVSVRCGQLTALSFFEDFKL